MLLRAARLCRRVITAAAAVEVVAEGPSDKLKHKKMANVILEIKDLKREFLVGSETVRALKGVTYNVNAGEFVTIMGSSGSGKTTMLNILGCLDKPSSGEYILDGVDIKKLGKNELFARQVSSRGGELFCELRGDRVKIAGHAALYMKGEIYIEEARSDAAAS